MMTNKEKARQFLESAIEAKTEIQRFKSRVAELESRCEKVTPGMSGMPGGGGSDAQAMWSLLADERAKLLESIKQELKAYHSVEAFINEIPDRYHRAILRLRYLSSMGWVGVQMKLYESGVFYSERHIYRLHDEALDSAAELWSKREAMCTHD